MYVIGGTNGNQFFDDVHAFDLQELSWSRVTPARSGGAKSQLTARSRHSAVAVNRNIYIFGGVFAGFGKGSGGNDIYILDTENSRWVKPKVSGRVPQARCVAAAPRALWHVPPPRPSARGRAVSGLLDARLAAVTPHPRARAPPALRTAPRSSAPKCTSSAATTARGASTTSSSSTPRKTAGRSRRAFPAARRRRHTTMSWSLCVLPARGMRGPRRPSAGAT